MAGKRRMRGDRAFKRLLKALPDSARKQMVVLLNSTGREQLSRAKALVPVGKTGELKRGLTFKVLPASLRLKVGLIGKPLNKRLFYGLIVEFGRRAQTKIVTRSGTLARARSAGLKVRSNRYKTAALSAGVKGAYKLKIRAMAPRHFVYNTSRTALNEPFRELWAQSLNRAANGISDA